MTIKHCPPLKSEYKGKAHANLPPGALNIKTQLIAHYRFKSHLIPCKAGNDSLRIQPAHIALLAKNIIFFILRKKRAKGVRSVGDGTVFSGVVHSPVSALIVTPILFLMAAG